MAKGRQLLFDNFFKSPEPVKQDRSQRPRNFYMPERNKLLAFRYYYHSTLLRKRYEDCLSDLEKEFFIVEDRIVVVLTENREMLEQAMKSNKTTKELSALYPHFNWKMK